MDLDRAAIAALSPNHVAAYLRQQGWNDGGKFGPAGRIFSRTHNASDSLMEVVVPTRAGVADFARRMAELVGDLSTAEDRSVSAVLFDLTLAPFDVIRIRDKDADSYGSVRFDEGLELHEEARNLIIAAARAAASDVARKAWKGRRPDTVTSYLQRVRLGQTEKRSFSVTILSPYAFEAGDQPSLLQDDAFGRRVTRKFGSALSAVETALADAVGSDIAAFESTIDQGVSSELCHSLSKLADNDSGIEISVSWSPAKPFSEPQKLVLTRQDSAILSEVARSFSAQEPEPEMMLEGPITVIEEAAQRFDGSAVIDALVGNRIRRVKVRFGPSERDSVFEAAKGKQWVRVVGEIVREGRGLVLADARGLEVIAPPED